MKHRRFLLLLSVLFFNNGNAQSLGGSLGSLDLNGAGSKGSGGSSLGLGGGGASGGTRLDLGGGSSRTTLGDVLGLDSRSRTLNTNNITTIRNTTYIDEGTTTITDRPGTIKYIRYEEEIRKRPAEVIVKKPKKPKQIIGYEEIIKTVRYEEDYVGDRRGSRSRTVAGGSRTTSGGSKTISGGSKVVSGGSKVVSGGTRTTGGVRTEHVRTPQNRKIVRYEEAYSDGRTASTGGRINPCRDIEDDAERKKCRQERFRQ